MKIPLVDLKNQHKDLATEINKSLEKIFESATFTRGTSVEKFEKKFANYIGVKHCIGVASGTDALHLSLAALDVGKGDEVILPVNTFVATAYAVLYVGAKPVFVDIDPRTFNVDINLLSTKITRKTKVLLPVHLYGQPVEMDKILSLAKKYKLHVIEDAAQAHGALYKRKRVGSFGILGAFSFYPAKNLGAYGDAGAITTNYSKLAHRLKGLREYGENSRYYYGELGYNSRLDQLQAAILTIKLKHLERWNAKRKKLANYYTKKIKEEISQVTPPFVGENVTHVYYAYVIKAPRRDQLAKYLKHRGIQTVVYYPTPLHLQKSLSNLGYKRSDFPTAESLAKQILSLPLYPQLTHEQQDYIIQSIKEFYEN